MINQNDLPKQPLDSVSRASMEDMAKAKQTPAMAQYLEIKNEYPEYLLFYRMGDFYELFFEDAVTASNALGLVLTSRSKTEEKNIPMCGVPFHAYEPTLPVSSKWVIKLPSANKWKTPKKLKKEVIKP